MKYNWNKEKNEILKETRYISFEEIVEYLEDGLILKDEEHPLKEKYPNQRIYYININDSLIGRDIRMVSRISKAAEGVRSNFSGYAGDIYGFDLDIVVTKPTIGPADYTADLDAVNLYYRASDELNFLSVMEEF